MKTLEEKKLLVKMMKAFNQPVDQELLESIEREERLAKLLFKEEKKEETPVLVEQQILIKEADPEPAPAQVLTPPIVTDTVTQTMNLLNTAAPKITSTLEKAEIEGIKRTLADLMKKIGTLSWGGGGGQRHWHVGGMRGLWCFAGCRGRVRPAGAQAGPVWARAGRPGL